MAGSHVLLAYLRPEMFPSLRSLLGAEQLWDRLAAPGLGFAVARSAACAAGILWVATQLNRLGFRLRL